MRGRTNDGAQVTEDGLYLADPCSPEPCDLILTIPFSVQNSFRDAKGTLVVLDMNFDSPDEEPIERPFEVSPPIGTLSHSALGHSI